MAKKKNLRQQREAEKQKRIQKAVNVTEIKKDPAEKVAEPLEKHILSEKKERKSYAKTAGLKSAFAVGDSVYLTSFGRGNKARLDTKILADNSVKKIISESEKHTLNVENASDSFFNFACRIENRKSASADNPTYNKETGKKSARQDMLGLKSTLERFYFGAEFDDNIHIQIAHNIQDIAKILSLYVNNIVYALDNMLAYSGEERTDLIGYLGTFPYEKYVPKNNDLKNFMKSERLGYFGTAFYYPNQKKRPDKEIYNIIALIGQLRQSCFHGQNKRFMLCWPYNFHNLCDRSFLDTLDTLYKEMLAKVNKNFLESNRADITILGEIYPDMSKKELVQSFYNFTTVKEYKNTGFSIKRIRENALEIDEMTEFRSQDYDTLRSKLYKLMDFCIYRLYSEKSERCEEITYSLRNTLYDEDKEIIYKKEARYIWDELKDKFKAIRSKMNGNTIAEIKEKSENAVSDEEFKEIMISCEVTYFTKLMYLLTFFLDGKEINDLLTTLVSKFDNIASFIDAAEQIGIKISFINEITVLSSSKKISNELNIILNFARMQKPSVKAKRVLQEDALRILGGRDEEINVFLEGMTGYDKNGKKSKDQNKGFRNFIVNNVIDSSRFRYLVRYSNPGKIRKLADNSKVIRFVLGNIPDLQIERYFKSCHPESVYESTEKARETLLSDIRFIKFEQFADVKQNDRKSTSQEKIQKEKYKALIGLYLTVLYLLVKNLVNVNSRYVTAFHCFERDALHYKIEWKDNDDYRAITRTLLAEGDASRSHFLARNKHMRECVAEDLKNSETLKNERNDALILFRNNVAHLSAIRNAGDYLGEIGEIKSYYALYHFIMQSKIASDCKRKGMEHDYFQNLASYKSYVKDYVKALCSPFGYNVPRFKSLTVEDLFDRNNPKDENKKDIQR